MSGCLYRLSFYVNTLDCRQQSLVKDKVLQTDWQGNMLTFAKSTFAARTFIQVSLKKDVSNILFPQPHIPQHTIFYSNSTLYISVTKNKQKLSNTCTDTKANKSGQIVRFITRTLCGCFIDESHWDYLLGMLL